MQGLVNFLLSDAGVLFAIILGIVFLTIVTYGVLMAKGFVSLKKTSSAGRTVTVKENIVGTSHSFLFVLASFVILVVGYAGVGFWNQITTEAPYIGDATYNFLFISMVIILLVSMLSLALVYIRLLGQFEIFKKIMG